MSTAVLFDPGRKTRPTDEELLAPVVEVRYEIVNGQRVEIPPMSIRAGTVATRLTTKLNEFADPKGLGEAFTEVLIQAPVPEDEGRNRRPDAFFVCYPKSKEVSPEDPDVNAWAVVPDLAVEVTSPTDRAEDQREKVVEYLNLGVRCVWVVYPRLGLVDVYEPGAPARTFGPGGVLPGDPVLPGLEIALADLFRPIGAPSR